jgi:hypothetical protein
MFGVYRVPPFLWLWPERSAVRSGGPVVETILPVEKATPVSPQSRVEFRMSLQDAQSCHWPTALQSATRTEATGRTRLHSMRFTGIETRCENALKGPE